MNVLPCNGMIAPALSSGAAFEPVHVSLEPGLV